MHVHGPGGSKVRPLIESPIISTYASAEGLFESEMGLHPGDPRELSSVGVNNSPEVTVLPRGHGLGAEKSLETIRHITAIGKDVNPTRGAGEGLGGRGDLGPLGRLPGPLYRPFDAQEGEVREKAPTGAGSPYRVATPPHPWPPGTQCQQGQQSGNPEFAASGR